MWRHQYSGVRLLVPLMKKTVVRLSTGMTKNGVEACILQVMKVVATVLTKSLVRIVARAVK